MQVDNAANPSIFKLMTKLSSPAPSAEFDPAVEKSAGPTVLDAQVSPLDQIMARYNLTNISPREVDSFAHELNSGGHISNEEFMILLSRGAEFMSHLPGNNIDDDRFDQKSNLIVDFQNSIKMSQAHGGPTASAEKLLALLEKMQSLGDEERDNAGRLPKSRISDRTMSDLVALQSEAGRI